MTLVIPYLRIFLFLHCCCEILGRNMRKTSLRMRHFSGGLCYPKDPPEVRDPRSRELGRIGADLAHGRSFLWPPLCLLLKVKTYCELRETEGQAPELFLKEEEIGHRSSWVICSLIYVFCHVPSLVTQILAWVVITICSQVLLLSGVQVPRRALQHGLWNQQSTGMGPAGHFAWVVRNPSRV